MAVENTESIDTMTSDLSLEEDDIQFLEKWDPVVQALTNTTRDSFADSPSFDPDAPEVFQSYWRDVFTRLRESISADEKIHKYLTEPPVKKFTATFFDAFHALACPCCHPDVDPNIVLENPDGVTKEDLVDGYIEAMYGEKLPWVWIEPHPMPLEEPEASAEDDVDEAEESDDEDLEEAKSEYTPGALAYACHWMSCGGDSDSGEQVVYNSQEPNIIFYCADPEEYHERREKEEQRVAAMEAKIKAREEEEAKTITKKASKL